MIVLTLTVKLHDYIAISIIRKDPFWSYANLHNLEPKKGFGRDILYMQ